ncbi:MAG: ribonuclease HI [Nitrospinae bacterium]|nr:ribonuclease HI [Nitrospinota bacterium]
MSEDSENDVIIYTDGACSGNPGPGGWAAALKCNGREKQLSGGEVKTTNNRMELQAILEAVKALGNGRTVRIYSDSQWSINVLTRRWRAKKNRDLIEAIWAFQHWKAVRLHWVRGHNGHRDNEKADRLANAAARKSGSACEAESSFEQFAEPSLAVLMGERMADESDRAFEPNTILGAG